MIKEKWTNGQVVAAKLELKYASEQDLNRGEEAFMRSVMT
jgi:hypothetical protein